MLVDDPVDADADAATPAVARGGTLDPLSSTWKICFGLTFSDQVEKAVSLVVGEVEAPGDELERAGDEALELEVPKTPSAVLEEDAAAKELVWVDEEDCRDAAGELLGDGGETEIWLNGGDVESPTTCPDSLPWSSRDVEWMINRVEVATGA
jgi:hypothetical protein